MRLSPIAGLALLLAGSAHAAGWSDTAIGLRAGSQFREPYNPDAIGKQILSFTHASGYRHGDQFLSLDLLKSDHRDPASPGGRAGAFEAYLVYRNTLDFGMLAGRDLGNGLVQGFGLSAGFDLNSKNDAGYNSRKRMWVLGPSVRWKLPKGRLNTALLMAWESNAPHGPFAPVSGVRGRYHYRPHPMLAADWGIPLGERVTFEGFLNVIAAKGRSETGGITGPETNLDMRLMHDTGSLLGLRPRALLVGVEYQYWHNKFGNSDALTGGTGNTARTPMLRVEHHF